MSDIAPEAQDTAPGPQDTAPTPAVVAATHMMPERVSEREEYAGLVTRALALGLDAVLLALAVSAIAAGAPAVWRSITGTTPRWVEIGAAVAAGALPFVYFFLCWCTTGRTAGGALMGTAVRRVDGSRVGIIHAAVRTVLGILFAPVWMVGMVLIAFDPYRRALHDVLFHTVVRRVGS